MLNHIVKRGVAHLQAAAPDYMARLQEDAQLYEKAGPAMEISPIETLPVLFTGIIVFLILASVSLYPTRKMLILIPCTLDPLHARRCCGVSGHD
jgi:hypothetical protein